MKKIKLTLLLPLLLAFVLALGSCLTVSATEVYPYPDDFESLGYDVIIKFLKFGSTDYYVITADGPCVFFNNGKYLDSYGDRLDFSDITKYRIYRCTNGLFSDEGIKEAPYYSMHHVYSNKAEDKEHDPLYSVVFSSFNIKYGNSSEIFFQVPLARLAVPLKAEVLKQTGIILPAGVGCLALLTGSVVLLPRLRRSLLRL